MTAAKLPLPALPWHCNHHEICALDADDALSSVHDSDGRLIAIVQPGPSQVGDLIALAPDLLATLTNLVSTLCRLDVELGVPIKVELPE